MCKDENKQKYSGICPLKKVAAPILFVYCGKTWEIA